jgi:hypothetical protein
MGKTRRNPEGPPKPRDTGETEKNVSKLSGRPSPSAFLANTLSAKQVVPERGGWRQRLQARNYTEPLSFERETWRKIMTLKTKNAAYLDGYAVGIDGKPCPPDGFMRGPAYDRGYYDGCKARERKARLPRGPQVDGTGVCIE